MSEIYTMPERLTGTVEEKLGTIQKFLIALVNKLNDSGTGEETALRITERLLQTDTGAGDGGEPYSFSQAAKDAATMKSQILKTANEMSEEIETIRRTLREDYVALSDFGAYRRQVESTFEATPETVSQYLHYEDTVADIDRLNEFAATMDGYVKVGIVEYEDGGMTPIVGIAMGQGLSQSGTQQIGGQTYSIIRKGDFSAVYTTKRLAFYKGEQMVAEMTGEALTISEAQIGSYCMEPSDDVDENNNHYVGMVFRRA